MSTQPFGPSHSRPSSITRRVSPRPSFEPSVSVRVSSYFLISTGRSLDLALRDVRRMDRDDVDLALAGASAAG